MQNTMANPYIKKKKHERFNGIFSSMTREKIILPAFIVTPRRRVLLAASHSP
jgi:hypothetical protein